MPYRYMRSILNIFVNSPMDALEDHARKVIEATDRLSEMLDAYLEGDCEKTGEFCKIIDGLEHEADKMKQQFQVVLPNSVVVQLDTNDLLAFLKLQDNIANRAQDAANWMMLRPGSKVPEDVKTNLRELMKMSMKCIQGHREIMEGLEKVEATSYSKVEIQKIIAQIPEIERMEYEVSVFKINVLKSVFDKEDEIGGAGICHIVRLIDNIGDIAYETGHAADIMRRILLKKA
jgi:Phosphate transport regulator (distant homolog of PhoU)